MQGDRSADRKAAKGPRVRVGAVMVAVYSNCDGLPTFMCITNGDENISL